MSTVFRTGCHEVVAGSRLCEIISSAEVTLVKGILAAVRSVGSTLVLLFLLLYVFSILFTQMLDSDPNFSEK